MINILNAGRHPLKFAHKALSVLLAAPLALTISVVGASASSADTCGDGLSLGVGGQAICLGPQEKTTPPATTPAPQPAAPTAAPVVAPPVVPAPIMTPGPVRTVTVEVPAPAAAPTQNIASPVAPTNKVTAVAPPVTPTAAPSASPSESPTAASIALQGTADEFSNPVLSAAPWVFFTALSALLIMLIVAKKKRLFPFEGTRAKNTYAPITATKDAGTKSA